MSKAALGRGTQLLAQAWAGSERRASAVDPGWCKTQMGGASAPRSSDEGSLSILALVVGSPKVIGSGRFFSPKAEPVPF